MPRQIEGFFGIPVDHLTGAPLLARYFHQYQAEHPGDYVVVAPDLGAVTRARDFAARLDCPLAVVDNGGSRPMSARWSTLWVT